MSNATTRGGCCEGCCNRSTTSLIEVSLIPNNLNELCSDAKLTKIHVGGTDEDNGDDNDDDDDDDDGNSDVVDDDSSCDGDDTEGDGASIVS